MWNAPKPEQLAEILPPLYATENIKTSDKVIGAHFFIGGCDWWLAEYDPEEDLGYGFVNLNDPYNAEWGYVALSELRNLAVKTALGKVEIDYDLHWVPKPAGEIPEINTMG